MSNAHRFEELKKQGWSAEEISALKKSLRDAALTTPPDLSVRIASITAGRKWEKK